MTDLVVSKTITSLGDYTTKSGTKHNRLRSATSVRRPVS